VLTGVNEDVGLPVLPPRPAIKCTGETLASISGRRVMVTGAGGSIGSELVKQIAALAPQRLLLVDSSEYNLYEIALTLDGAGLPFAVRSFIADVRDPNVMRHLVVKEQPQLIVHAAALKHVPLLEQEHNLIEGVLTNVYGTKNLVDLAANAGIDFMMVSTDKAVNPSSCMGLTKRVAEIYVHARALSSPGVRIRQVRFGNVLGSSGSVVPLFRRQIAQGGPVTVTHPDMTRYVMTIAEAVQLVLAASSIEHDGYGLYVLDMGEPVRIVDLARDLIRKAGLRPDIDMPIEFIGVRPGEKLFEDLTYGWEQLTPTEVPRVRRAVPSFDPVAKLGMIDALLAAASSRDAIAVKARLVDIVPEYSGQSIWV